MKFYKIIIFLLIALKSLKGDVRIKEIVRNKVLEIKEKHKIMYGEPSNKISKPYVDETLEYPGECKDGHITLKLRV